MNGEYSALWLVVWAFAGAVIGYLLGLLKGRPHMGAVMSAFLGPIGWFLILVGPDFRRKCRLCKAAIPQDAIRCMHCGGDLAEREPAKSEYTPLPIPPPPKCKCNVCSQLIEFNEDGFDYRNPPTINCPHCGMETKLYIPEVGSLK
jgi:rRNA maturation protein Nop10